MKASVLTHTCRASSQAAEEGESTAVCGQPGLPHELQEGQSYMMASSLTTASSNHSKTEANKQLNKDDFFFFINTKMQ